MSVINLNDTNFELEVLNSDKPVLVDFFAVWCGPCKMVSPIIEEIAEERQDIKVCKVNVDEAPALAERFSVSSIPTLAVFKNGELVRMETGARPKPAILALID
ncbi:MAG: thioredoxin [Acutalibacteraceae bacterium]|nr:thioredoxin [Acutalibacteraceae bacterium]